MRKVVNTLATVTAAAALYVSVYYNPIYPIPSGEISYVVDVESIKSINEEAIESMRKRAKEIAKEQKKASKRYVKKLAKQFRRWVVSSPSTSIHVTHTITSNNIESVLQDVNLLTDNETGIGHVITEGQEYTTDLWYDLSSGNYWLDVLRDEHTGYLHASGNINRRVVQFMRNQIVLSSSLNTVDKLLDTCSKQKVVEDKNNKHYFIKYDDISKLEKELKPSFPDKYTLYVNVFKSQDELTVIATYKFDEGCVVDTETYSYEFQLLESTVSIPDELYVIPTDLKELGKVYKELGGR